MSTEAVGYRESFLPESNLNAMNSNNFDLLIAAIAVVESRDRGRTVESEHGYASTLPMPEEIRKKNKSKKSQGNRSTHNELEKNRRAHLRHCLERLKDMVPLGPDASRHTQLGLLTKAKTFIKQLEDKERRQRQHKEKLEREKRFLLRRLTRLTEGQYRTRVERSISESSTTTSVSSASSFGESAESEDVDILGDISNSDDDHSSIQSIGSDGGISVTTRQLTL